MHSLKRSVALGLTSLIIAGLSPLTTFANLPAGTTLITVTSSTQSFDPSINQVAAINYTVTGPASASNVFMRIYKTAVTDGSRVCNNLSENYVSTIEGPITRPVGNYTAVWTGRNQSGFVVPPASYCFDLRWGNMPPGVLTPFLEGLIQVVQPGAGGGGGGPGGGGGVGPGGGGVGGAQAAQITASVDPLVINPTATEGNSAYINYTVNQTLTNGFTLKVYDSGNFVVKDLYGTSQSVPAGTNATIPWNGRRNNGTVVLPGDYFYKFRVSGVDVATGLIRVEYGVTPQADIVHYANPSVINPTATPAQVSIIYYTVNRRVTAGLTISVKDGNNNSVRTLFGTTAPIAVGSYQVSWNGRYNNGTVVPIGTYRYVFISAGQEVGFGTIGVTYQTDGGDSIDIPLPPFILGIPTAVPNTFTPALGQTTTISYTLGKPVTNFKFSIRNALGAEMVTVTSANRAAGSYTYLWNGLLGGFSPIPVPAGLYTYVLEATNENPVTGTVSVTALAQTAPVITDLGPEPASFQANGGTTNFRYQVNQNARCDFTVWNGTPGTAGSTVVRRLQNGISTFTTNCSLSGPSSPVTWDGRNDSGTPVAPGTYYYLIEAVNGNGTAQSRSGTVTVTAQQQQPVLDVSNVLANPNTFNPDLGQTTLFTFSLNQGANVTMTVTRASDNSFVKTLVSNQFYNAGSNQTVLWNGTDWNGQLVSQGVYNFRVDGTSAQYGSDSGSASVTVNRGGVQQQVLDVSNAFANPSFFNSDLGQTTLLTFSLNQAANVTLTVTRASDNAFVKTVVSNQPYNIGSNLTVTWNGTDWNNQFVSQGTYNFRVDASSAQYGSDFATGSVTVNRGTQSQSQVLDVFNAFASPNSFNPEVQNTALTFSLNQPANVTVTVTRQSDGTFVKTVVSNQYYNAGTNLTAVWSGTDWNNAFVASGTYNFRVDATSSQYGSDSVTASVTVNRQGTLQILGGDAAVPNPFNPSAGQVTRIDFSTTVTPQTLTVRIYRTTTNVFVREVPILTLGTNSYRAEWNGRDGATNNIVSNDHYTYRIEATYLGQTAQKSGTVTVGSVGTVALGGGVGVVVTDCGDFTDVAAGHTLCAALKFVKVRGIFRGYDDGSIGLNRVIQRAELLAVIQKAFRYPLDPYSIEADGNLDRSDLSNKTHMWYMPYLKTFKRLGLMVGYPDGKMRPERTMNTAELYLVFLKAANQAPENIDHFNLENHVKSPPFKDVPLSHTWYIKYAAFAQLNDLVTTERFYPGRGITRGQVIKLIYDTHLKGLITYGPPL